MVDLSRYTPGIFGWDATTGVPPPPNGMEYVGVVYVDGITIPHPLSRALASGINGDAALVLSNMAAEPDQSPGMDVHGQSAAEWNSTLHAAFASWSPVGVAADVIGSLYSNESAIDAQLAYDALTTDYGLTCANSALASEVAAGRGASLRQAPTYLLFNAWKRSKLTNEPQQWPFHYQDWADMTKSWNFEPATTDEMINRILIDLFSDFVQHSGQISSNWNWPPVSADSVSTFVLAQSSGWPGGGVRSELNWKNATCSSLSDLEIDQSYWWCD